MFKTDEDVTEPPSEYCVVVGVLTISQNTVYFRWPVEKVRVLYTNINNKKIDPVPIADEFKLFVKKNGDIVII
jgi:hypothetical protein